MMALTTQTNLLHNPSVYFNQRLEETITLGWAVGGRYESYLEFVTELVSRQEAQAAGEATGGTPHPAIMSLTESQRLQPQQSGEGGHTVRRMVISQLNFEDLADAISSYTTLPLAAQTSTIAPPAHSYPPGTANSPSPSSPPPSTLSAPEFPALIWLFDANLSFKDGGFSADALQEALEIARGEGDCVTISGPVVSELTEIAGERKMRKLRRMVEIVNEEGRAWGCPGLVMMEEEGFHKSIPVTLPRADDGQEDLFIHDRLNLFDWTLISSSLTAVVCSGDLAVLLQAGSMLRADGRPLLCLSQEELLQSDDD
ncbi:hypothetical protein IAT38_003397 [Cryptococcus sp. DSM 104549]